MYNTELFVYLWTVEIQDSKDSLVNLAPQGLITSLYLTPVTTLQGGVLLQLVFH